LGEAVSSFFYKTMSAWEAYWCHLKAHSLCKLIPVTSVRHGKTWRSWELNWCRPEPLHHDPMGRGNHGSGITLAQLPEDVPGWGQWQWGTSAQWSTWCGRYWAVI